MNEAATKNLVQGSRVKHANNPNKVGTVLQDLHPNAPVFGQVKINWDDNNKTSLHSKFTVKKIVTNWML